MEAFYTFYIKLENRSGFPPVTPSMERGSGTVKIILFYMVDTISLIEGNIVDRN